MVLFQLAICCATTNNKGLRKDYIMESATSAFLCVLVAILLYVLQRKPKNYPPGNLQSEVKWH